MDKTSNPWAVIPISILNDEDLSGNEKMLYAHISSLSRGERGYCFASNSYLAEKLNTSERSIKRWIKKLIDKKYIISEMEYKENSKEIQLRKLFLSNLNFDKSNQICGDINVKRSGQECQKVVTQMTPWGDTDVPDNNISNNNTYNNISYIGKDKNSLISAPKKSNFFIAPNLDEVKNFIAENNISVDAEQFYYHYESNGWMVGKNKMKDWHCAVKYWARNSKSFNNAPKKRRNGLF